jgi:hypothetical protein
METEELELIDLDFINKKNQNYKEREEILIKNSLHVYENCYGEKCSEHNKERLKKIISTLIYEYDVCCCKLPSGVFNNKTFVTNLFFKGNFFEFIDNEIKLNKNNKKSILYYINFSNDDFDSYTFFGSEIEKN